MKRGAQCLFIALRTCNSWGEVIGRGIIDGRGFCLGTDSGGHLYLYDRITRTSRSGVAAESGAVLPHVFILTFVGVPEVPQLSFALPYLESKARKTPAFRVLSMPWS